MARIREELKTNGIPVTDEMAVLHAMFPEQLKAYLKPAPAPVPPSVEVKTPAAAPVVASAPRGGVGQTLSIAVNGTRFDAIVEEVG
jgi:oxaloacetate decarboxylase alpha subunit/pyruvate carboxylase subunit B